MSNEHTSLEKHTSHILFERVVKGLCVRGELETEQTATYWHSDPLTIAALLFSYCPAAQPGVLRAQTLCRELVLTASNCNSNSNCNWRLLPVGVSIASNSNRPRSRLYLDIFDRMHIFLDWRVKEAKKWCDNNYVVTPQDLILCLSIVYASQLSSILFAIGKMRPKNLNAIDENETRNSWSGNCIRWENCYFYVRFEVKSGFDTFIFYINTKKWPFRIDILTKI